MQKHSSPRTHGRRPRVHDGSLAVLAALMAGVSAASQPAPLLAFDPARAANGAIPDSTGHGVLLQLGKGARVQPGGPGGRGFLAFDGSAAAESIFTSPEEFDNLLKGDEVSVSFWLRADAFQEGTIGLGYSLLPRGIYEQAPLRFQLKTRETAFGAYELRSGTDRPMHTGHWHHVAFAYSLSNRQFAAYYDGRVQARHPLTQDEPSPVESLLQPIGQAFPGAIAELRIWNRALSEEELLAFQPPDDAARALQQRFEAAAAVAVHPPFRDWCARLAGQVGAGERAAVSIRAWQRLQRFARELDTLVEWTRPLAPFSSMAAAPFASFTFYPYDKAKRLPHILPHDGRGTHRLTTSLAQGEYEGVTFMLRPFRDVAALEIRATPLTQGATTLPEEALTIRAVKCWHTTQSGWNTYFAGGREFPTLAPELLLFDNDLIRVDVAARRNLLRIDYPDGPRYVDISVRDLQNNVPAFNYMIEPVRDATTLQPLPLTEGLNQQFWITVHAPDDAPPGRYTSSLQLMADGAPAGALSLEVTVHPFRLPRPRTNYDLDREYYGTLMHHINLSDQLELGKNRGIAERRLLAEMRNMRAHNMLHPHSPGFDDPQHDDIAKRHYAVMRAAGMPLKPAWAGRAMDASWFVQRLQDPRTSPETDPEGFQAAMARHRAHIDRKATLLQQVLGHRDIYLYGWDEAGPSGVRHEFPFFAYAQRLGFKIFITSGVAEWAAFVVDANDEPASIRRSVSETWHAGGAINTSYAAPFTGPENPEVWRRNKGIRLYLANYDGINEYNWYEGYHIWNEFIGPGRYRNFNLVYPTLDGVIDTIAWEALREAFDDVRYATLLRQRAAAALASEVPAARTLARRALLWIGSIDPESVDLDAMRATMVDWIHQLGAADAAGMPPAASDASLPLPPPPGADPLPELDGLPPEARVQRLLARAATYRQGNTYDVALELYGEALTIEGISQPQRAEALLGVGTLARELRRTTESIAAFEALAVLPGATPAQAAEACTEQVNTLLHPTEVDWTPPTDRLQAALAVYDRCQAQPGVTPGQRLAMLTRIARAQLAAGRREAALQTASRLLQTHGFSARQTAEAHELIGDCQQALGSYAQAVVHYELAIPADKYRLLNKLGDAARKGKLFTKAMEAYADLVPLIDKVEAKDDYNRVTRLLVAMTQATRKMMKTPPATQVFRSEHDRAIGEITLDDPF